MATVIVISVAMGYVLSQSIRMIWDGILTGIDWIDRLVNPVTRARIKRHKAILAQFRREIELHGTGRK